MLSKAALHIIKKLGLQKHPEGGYFKETYRSDTRVNTKGYNGSRHAATAIYYLLIGNQFSAFHKMKSDEIWHHYAGGSLILYAIDNRKLAKINLGRREGERFQAVVKAGAWFAASLNDKRSFCLLGCTVSPGFEYGDWELGKREELIRMYPRHKEIIKQHTII